MGVTTDGIKGYEYQYKVTVFIALTTGRDKFELYVEKESSEDASLLIDDRGSKTNVDIQVKREKSLIDIAKLVDWLRHFQERSSDNNLLQRLIDSTNFMVLFVTHSRCSDSLINLRVNPLAFSKNESISLSQNFCDEFRQTLKSTKLGSTKLKQNRENFCKSQADNLTNTELKRILQQCLIFEEFTDEKVDNHINSILNSNYSIAQSRTNIVYLQLLEIVREGRDDRSDISKKINDYLQSEKIGKPTIDSQYKVREEENILINQLKEKGTLLLTGLSQCGKTELAKTIASHFVEEGFDFQIDDDISAVKRFLKSNISDNKVAILEDPFGHISLRGDYIEIKRKIEDLIGNKEKHHFVIVSSRIELLPEIFASPKTSHFNIKGHNWHDLTIQDNERINSFWQLIAKEKSLPNEIISVVSNGILTSETHNILQIGQLIYLVNEEINQLTNKDYSELEHIARRNSIEIAHDLKAKNNLAASILAICSICSNPIHKLEFQDLAYILSDISDLLSIRNGDPDMFTITDTVSPQFPKYPYIPLTREYEAAISYLEERGLITVSSNALLITHPNYYEAGRSLFFETSSLKQSTKLNQLKRSVTCLNPISALLATMNLSFIYNRVKEEYKNTIVQIGFIGLDSIFPSVEDVSLIFLTKLIHNLDEEKVEQLVDKIQRGGTSSSNIYWHDNIPFISNKSSFLKLFIANDETIIKQAEASITKGVKPNIYEAWIYINGLKKEKLISLKDIRLLFQFNEGFVRQKVVYKAFLYPEIIDSELILDFFNDEHPSVVFSALRAALQNWFSLSDSLQSFIKELSIKSLTKKDIAIRTFSLISTFSIDYGHEAVFKREFDEDQKRSMWEVWGELFPVCFENVPLGVHINSARFGATMTDSISYLDVNIGLKVSEAWYKRIDSQIENKKTLSEFEMAIADYLMQITLHNANARKELFLQLVEYKNTSFILSSLKWIIEYWSHLENYEKDKIIALISSDRIDVRWIKAVLLNSSYPPEEIVNEILEDKGLFEKDIEQILNVFPDELLKDCLNVYFGCPDPLWSLAVHHKNSTFWLKIIRAILLNENHTGFAICLQEFVKKGVYGLSFFKDDDETFWVEMCSAIKKKDILTTSLINNMALANCAVDSTREMWASLIKSYEDNLRVKDLVKCIQDNIELILYSFKKDFVSVIDEQFLIKTINPAINWSELTKEKIEIVGKKSKEEAYKVFNYKLDNWIGEN